MTLAGANEEKARRREDHSVDATERRHGDLRFKDVYKGEEIALNHFKTNITMPSCWWG